MRMEEGNNRPALIAAIVAFVLATVLQMASLAAASVAVRAAAMREPANVDLAGWLIGAGMAAAIAGVAFWVVADVPRKSPAHLLLRLLLALYAMSFLIMA
jgi:hypothetical protein